MRSNQYDSQIEAALKDVHTHRAAVDAAIDEQTAERLRQCLDAAFRVGGFVMADELVVDIWSALDYDETAELVRDAIDSLPTTPARSNT